MKKQSKLVAAIIGCVLVCSGCIIAFTHSDLLMDAILSLLPDTRVAQTSVLQAAEAVVENVPAEETPVKDLSATPVSGGKVIDAGMDLMSQGLVGLPSKNTETQAAQEAEPEENVTPEPVVNDAPEEEPVENDAPEEKVPESEAEATAPTILPGILTQEPEPTKAPETQAPEEKEPETKALLANTAETQAPEVKEPETKEPETEAYVPEVTEPETTTAPPVEWWEVYASMYTTSMLTIRSAPSVYSDVVDYLDLGDEVYVYAQSDDNWSKIDYNGGRAYVSSAYLTWEKPEVPTEPPAPTTTAYYYEEPYEEPSEDPYEEPTYVEPTGPSGWDGGVLTPTKGVNAGPSGTETYYNLDMSVVVRVLQSRGYEGEYWVRSDGCKMFGDYIMCAAHYEIYPYGSIVESSLGTCIVCDTGPWPEPYWLDIAVTW